MQNLQNFEKPEQYENQHSARKYSLMRAERQAIFASIMSNLMLRELLPTEKWSALKEQASEIMSSGWNYESVEEA